MRKTMKSPSIILVFSLILTSILSYFTVEDLYASEVLTVEEAIERNDEKIVATVEGYIIGTAGSDPSPNKAKYYLTPVFDNPNNIVLADTLDERDEKKFLPIKFDSRNPYLQSQLNLKDHPNNYRKRVQVTGTLEEFFTVPGMKNPTGFAWVPLKVQHMPPNEVVEAEKEITLSFTASGGKGTVTATVYYRKEEDSTFRILGEFKGHNAIIPASEVYGDLEYYIIFQDEETVIRLPEEIAATYQIMIERRNTEEPKEPKEDEEPNEIKEPEGSEEPETPEESQTPEKPKEPSIPEESEKEEKESSGDSGDDETGGNERHPLEKPAEDDEAKGFIEEAQERVEDSSITEFVDIKGHWAEEKIKRLAEKKIIRGYSDGSFRPDAPIKRGELIVLVIKILGVNLEKSEGIGKPLIHWAEDYIVAARAIAIVEDYDHTMRGLDEYPTGEEVMELLAKALSIKDFGDFSLYYQKETVTRAEAILLLFDLYYEDWEV